MFGEHQSEGSWAACSSHGKAGNTIGYYGKIG